MKAQFVENYSKLSDMKPGQVAVSVNREHIFICGWRYKTPLKDDESKLERVILNLGQLSYQYPENWDDSIPIRILKKGDKFTLEVERTFV